MKRMLQHNISSVVIFYFCVVSVGNLAPQEMLSAKFGLGRNSSYSLGNLIVSTNDDNSNSINSELDTIAEEDNDEERA